MKRMALSRQEILDIGGSLYMNTPTGPTSVDFILAVKRLIPAEIMAQYYYETGEGASDPIKGRAPDAEPVASILTRFAELPPAF